MKRVPVRITCDPDVTELVIVIGDGADALAVGIPVEDVPRLFEETAIARDLVLQQRNRGGVAPQ